MVAAAKSGDVVFITSLFVNELSDLVVFEKPKLVSVLTKTGVKVKAGDSAETIVDKTFAALPKNTQLQKGLAFLFTEINGLINNNKGNKQTWKQIIDDISGGVTLVANKLGQPGSYAASTKADIMLHVANKKLVQGNSKADGAEDEVPKGWSTTKKVLVFGSIAAVLFFGIRYIAKNLVLDVDGQTVPPLPIAGGGPPPIPQQPVIAPAPPVVPHPSMPIQQPIAQPIQQPVV